MIIGVIKALIKVVCGIINIFQPSKDGLVDKIEFWGEKIQGWLFKASELLKKFPGSIR
jgi:hypothetical protein